MNKFSKALIAIFMIGALSQSCGLIPVLEDVFSRLPNPAPLELYVSKTGLHDNDCLEATPCLTVREAYDKSTTNSTIHIGAGEFLEMPGINLNNGVTLIGAGADLTTIRSIRSAFVLEVGGWRPVTIRELGVIGPGAVDVGISVTGGASVLLENCRVALSAIGIRVQSDAVATVNHCVIAGNRQGVFIPRGGSASFDGDNVFEENIAGLVNFGTLRMAFTTFRQNTGTSLHNGGDAIIGASIFDDNILPGAAHRIPIIKNTGNMEIRQSTISNNNGIAVSNQIAGSRPDALLSLQRVQIFLNFGPSPYHQPCAVSNVSGLLSIFGSVIQNNDCVGIDVYGGEVHIDRSAIISNKIGMFVRGESIVNAKNTTFSDNLGFGIEQVEYGSLELINVTVADNRGTEISSGNPAEYLVMTDTVIFGVCSINIVPTDFTCNNDWTQSTIGLGPLTEEEGTFVHPLLPGSPLIDAGVECSVYDDQRLHVRPGGGVGCDVGAYERDSSTTAAPLEFVTPSGGVPGVIPLYTDTPTPAAPVILTFAKNAYCRKGPSSLYKDVSGFIKGDTAQADGRNETDPRWWWVQIPNSNEHCWVSYITVNPNDIAENLPIEPTADLELPAAPGNFVISKRLCSQNGYGLQFSWSKSAGADGYTLYLNGQEIATLKSNVTSYQENPPLDKSLHYELEAFNENGFSERLVIEDRCP